MQLTTANSESEDEPEMMRAPFTQWPSTTATQNIQVNLLFFSNTLKLVKNTLQVTATAAESDNKMTRPPFTQCTASSATKCAFEGDIISDSKPGTASEDDLMVVDISKTAASEKKASHKAPHATASVDLVLYI